ncbi:radial spoke head 10 homolog B-like isoform X2 [Podarcis raffonei]|uniref:radial spoke head 10 homolog B-like isoform X2 n=1 Tax=Podarcis raffonei TaxID=65483 RepID=UPI0023298FDD|nr:radial spoke head 10 homolog B-like isoform X2 [Podarcis raffonei]
MGKEKKRDSKKGEKSLPPPSAHEPSVEPATSVQNIPPAVNQVDEQAAAQTVPQEEVKEAVALPPPEPIEYEEPILTQLIVESYEGEKICGLYEGEGTACFQGGNVYKGMFSEGLMHGQGTYTWADGVKYEGNFVKNLQMHHGSYTWPDGSVYDGEVKSGIRHGFGMYKCGTYPVSYIGQWVEGKRHGKGTIYYNKEGSSWYEGDFVYNVKSGWGIRCYKSGNIYEGQWERDMRHGEGRMRWLTTNQEYTGQWVNGIQHGYGTHTWYLKRIPGSQYPLRNEYVGDFVNGDRHGHGKFFFASGAMYDGQWVHNKKQGMGKLVFKNGRVYEGEFIDDHMAEYPSFQIDIMNNQDLSGIRTTSPFGTESIKVVDGPDSTSALGTNIEIDISTLLAIFPEENREEEIKQTEFAVLRYISELRRIYTFYSSLGYDHSLDNTFLMTKLQFWRFLKDCRFHHCNLTLADMDRILNDKTLLEEIHSPYETLLLRMFLTYLIYLSFHIYHKEFDNTSPRLFKCFCKLMVKNICPNACQIKGILFSDRQQTVYAINYIDKCWEIFRAFCRPNPVAPYEPTMKMRHFLWMLKDLRLVSKQLTATKIVNILAKDSPCVRDGEDTNLEHELVFLEFFEALLDCALLYVTDEMLKQQAEESSCSTSSFRTDEFIDPAAGPPLAQDLSSGQSVQTRSLSSGETSTETTETLHVKASTSKIVHFVDVGKGKKSEKGKGKNGGKEGKGSRHGSKSPSKEKSLSPQAMSFNVTFSAIVEEKEESSAPSLSSAEAGQESILSAPMKELADNLESAKNEQKDKLGLWMSQIYIFFVNKFFAGYKHLEVVKETIIDNRIRHAEFLVLKKIQEAEEEAKLNAMREAEEARKLEEAAAEKAAQELEESLCRELEEASIQLQSSPKEESPVSPQAPPSTKTTGGGKKKKKA